MTVNYANVKIPLAEEILDPLLYATFTMGLPLQHDVDKLSKYKERQTILVACMPRSGATWLTNTLRKLTEFPFFRLTSAYGTNEHDLYLPALCMNAEGCIALLHMKGTYHNNELMKLFNIKPIILINNIYNMILNLANNCRAKQKFVASRTGLLGYSFMWSDVNIEKLSDCSFLDWIIDFATPWYINFYVSWYRLNPDALWITCKELIKIPDRVATVRKILSFLDIIPKNDFHVDIITKEYDTMDGEPIFNKLSFYQAQRINKYFDYYQDVDFSKYGMVEKEK